MMRRMLFLHLPQDVPAPQRAPTFFVDLAPDSMTLSISAAVTARQMQTYTLGS